jgi:GDP-mannose 4,6-dehydratase
MVEHLLKNTNLLIFGGVRRLSVYNHENIRQIKSDRFHLINFDLTDAHSISRTIEKLKPDYFMNFAAQSFVASSWDFARQTWETNSTAILDILEAIRLYNPSCRLYQAGSSEEFGNVLYSPQDENHPLRPRSPYGASKCASRQLIKVYRESYNLYAIQGWLFNHEGTRRGEEFVTRKITKNVAIIYHSIQNNEEFEPLELGNIEAQRDWSDAEDFVEGIWMMLNQDRYNKNYNGMDTWPIEKDMPNTQFLEIEIIKELLQNNDVLIKKTHREIVKNNLIEKTEYAVTEKSYNQDELEAKINKLIEIKRKSIDLINEHTEIINTCNLEIEELKSYINEKIEVERE